MRPLLRQRAKKEKSHRRVKSLHTVQVHAELAGVGLSIATPEAEVLYMLLDGIRVRATSSKVSRMMEACVRKIQASPDCPQCLK